MVFYIMVVNCLGLVGKVIFCEEDVLFYFVGFIIIVSFSVVGVVFFILVNV